MDRKKPRAFPVNADGDGDREVLTSRLDAAWASARGRGFRIGDRVIFRFRNGRGPEYRFGTVVPSRADTADLLKVDRVATKEEHWEAIQRGALRDVEAPCPCVLMDGDTTAAVWLWGRGRHFRRLPEGSGL